MIFQILENYCVFILISKHIIYYPCKAYKLIKILCITNIIISTTIYHKLIIKFKKHNDSFLPQYHQHL